jgi:hypothetical protein
VAFLLDVTGLRFAQSGRFCLDSARRGERRFRGATSIFFGFGNEQHMLMYKAKRVMNLVVEAGLEYECCNVRVQLPTYFQVQY